jgi:hypothetical protein
MLIQYFNVSADGKSLQLRVRVCDEPAFADVYIDRIALGITKDVSYNYPFEPRWEEVFTQDKKEVEISIPIHLAFLGLPRNKAYMYVLWARTGGEIAIGDACCCGSDLDIAVAVDFRPLYNETIHLFEGFVREHGKGRDRLLDLYLRKGLFLDTVKEGDYLLAARFFEEFIEEDLTRCLHHKHGRR